MCSGLLDQKGCPALLEYFRLLCAWLYELDTTVNWEHYLLNGSHQSISAYWCKNTWKSLCDPVTTLCPGFTCIVKKCWAANAALGRAQTYTFVVKLQNYSENSLEEEQGENVGSGPRSSYNSSTVFFAWSGMWLLSEICCSVNILKCSLIVCVKVQHNHKQELSMFLEDLAVVLSTFYYENL